MLKLCSLGRQTVEGHAGPLGWSRLTIAAIPQSGRGRFVVPSLVIRSRRRYRQPEKEVNVVCIGKQNHHILYVKMKLQASLGTWAAKMMQGETL